MNKTITTALKIYGKLFFDEHFSENNDNCKFNSKQSKILTEIVAAFSFYYDNNQTVEYGGYTYENAKKKAIHLTNVYLVQSN